MRAAARQGAAAAEGDGSAQGAPRAGGFERQAPRMQDVWTLTRTGNLGRVHRMKPRWSLLLVVGLVSVLLALPAAALAQATGEVEIFSWWAGDEGPALEAIIAEFEKRNPGVRINNATVTGGAGVNA